MEIGKIELKIEGLNHADTLKYQEIFSVLAASGSLKLKGVAVAIHLDRNSTFQGLEIQNFWPWRRVSKDLPAIQTLTEF